MKYYSEKAVKMTIKNMVISQLMIEKGETVDLTLYKDEIQSTVEGIMETIPAEYED